MPQPDRTLPDEVEAAIASGDVDAMARAERHLLGLDCGDLACEPCARTAAHLRLVHLEWWLLLLPRWWGWTVAIAVAVLHGRRRGGTRP